MCSLKRSSATLRWDLEGYAEMEYKLVLLVRSDLKLGCGKWCAQVGHAAVGCAMKARKERPKWFRAWYAEGQRKVVLRVEDLDELMALERSARERCIPTTLVRDAGLTQVPPGTVTCLGIGPAPESTLDAITGHLKLMP